MVEKGQTSNDVIKPIFYLRIHDFANYWQYIPKGTSCTGWRYQQVGTKMQSIDTKFHTKNIDISEALTVRLP